MEWRLHVIRLAKLYVPTMYLTLLHIQKISQKGKKGTQIHFREISVNFWVHPTTSLTHEQSSPLLKHACTIPSRILGNACFPRACAHPECVFSLWNHTSSWFLIQNQVCIQLRNWVTSYCVLYSTCDSKETKRRALLCKNQRSSTINLIYKKFPW